MSRVGQQAIEIPSGVDVRVDGQTIAAKGPQGELAVRVPDILGLEVGDGRVTVTRRGDSPRERSLHGLNRSLVANMLEGVSKGFSEVLVIEGVGFRASVQGQKVVLSLGFSSPVEYEAPDGIQVTTKGDTILTISGPDRQKVGEVAARIRAFYPAEPYKGKGIRYEGEHVRRKTGKSVA
jgi:large subunit ribosomal protein L6